MQVVILCGGQGTRIRDVAPDLPKPMIPIGDRPILWHIMKLYAHHGFQRFILCLGYRSWDIKRYFLDYLLAHADITLNLQKPDSLRLQGPVFPENWDVTLAETGKETMTGGRVKAIEKYLIGDDFHLTYGDGVGNVDLGALVDFHRRHGKIGTVTAVQPPGRFGEIDIAAGRVQRFSEKPPSSRGRISAGFFVLNRRLFDRLPDDPGLVFEQAPLSDLAADGELMAYKHDGFWHPMDNSRDYKLLNDMWAGGDAPWRVWTQSPALRVAA